MSARNRRQKDAPWPADTCVTLVCKECNYTARRKLMLEPGSRGTCETSSEPGYCPRGHGLLVRKDGVPQERWAAWKDDPRWAMRQERK